VRLIFRVAIFLAPLLPIFATRPVLEENRGQFSSNVQFVAKRGPVSIAVTKSGISFRNAGDQISLRLDGARLGQCLPGSAKESESHYLAMNPPISNVSRYSSVICRGVYPGIDWVIRISGGSLEHDWKLAAGADPRRIAMVVEGGGSAKVTANGSLLLHSGKLTIAWRPPQSYQEGPRASHVESTYEVKGKRIRLAIGRHRRDRPLVIDPVIDFSYVINANEQDFAYQVGVDAAGNIYLAGLTNSSDFATTAGVVFATPTATETSASQVFVRALSPDGSKELYSTYLGLGETLSSHPMGMRVDPAGDVYLSAVGFFNAPSGSATVLDPGGAVSLYKIAPGGGKLIYEARLLPGNYPDPVALAIDGSGNAYVGIGDNPIRVAKVDPTGQKQLFLYQSVVSNYNGGLMDLAVGGDGTVYFAGSTAMGGLTTTPGALQTTVQNPLNSHGFLTRLKADGSAPIFTTYIAGQMTDSISALLVDASGAAYVGGQTVSQGALLGLQGTSLGLTQAPATAGFIMKVDPQGATALFTALLPNSAVTAMALDTTGNVYASGPIGTLGIAAAKIDPTGKQLLYYSTIPGPAMTGAGPTVGGMAADPSGGAYLAGSISSIQIPDMVQTSVLQPNAFLLKIDPNPSQCDLSLETSSPATYDYGTPLSQVFTVRNAGPAAAENVVFSATPKSTSATAIYACRATGVGACGSNPNSPWVYFPSIPAGGTETVELDVDALIPSPLLTTSATVSTVTSDISQANNSAVAMDTPVAVPVNIQSNLQDSYVLSPATGFSYTVAEGAYAFVPPNTQFQVFWPSPQQGRLGLGAFQAWQDGSTDNPRTFASGSSGVTTTATFTRFSGPYFSAASVANAGSNTANGVSPGELVALYGFNLSVGGTAQVVNGQLPTSLGGTTVTFDGYPAPLIYDGLSQINAVVPYEIAGETTTNVTVKGSLGTFTQSIPVVQAVPALFTANSSGSGQAAALNQDGSVNSPANPANAGEVIVLFGTGEGVVNPLPKDGVVTLVPAPTPQLAVTVSIGGQPATVTYAAEAPGLVSGVIQINAVIPAGVQASHHVPVTWSAGNVVSQPGVTIAMNDSPTTSAVYPSGTDDLSLSSILISPTHIAADSDATTITVSGSAFARGMVVFWNNQVRPTTFLSATQLQVTLSGNDLETPQLGAIAVWDAAQTHQISQTAPVIVYLPVLNNAMIYDSTRDKIYVAVAQKQSPQGSSIAVVNPETGRIERWYSLTVEPTVLAMSDDGQYLYAALRSVVRRINLNSWAAELEISLGQNTASSILVLPGQNSSIAVCFPQGGVAIFDEGGMRPAVVGSSNSPTSLFGGANATTLYGGDAYGNFYVLALTSGGVQVAQSVAGLLGSSGDGVYAGGLVYDSAGQAIDPLLLTVAMTFNNTGLIVPLLDLQEVLILASYSPFALPPALSLHNSGTGQRIWSMTLPITFTVNHGPMLRWGTNGIAIREPQVNSLTAPGIDLLRLTLSN
jgi:uncharacterized protein (TIGR03437 family)